MPATNAYPLDRRAGTVLTIRDALSQIPNPLVNEAITVTTLAEFAAWVQQKLFFLDYAPVIFTSAKSGFLALSF